MDHNNPVGIMADSHGDLDALLRALAFFNKNRCRPIFHLGDIGDTCQFETLDACVDLLVKHKVLAVKGNNDHSFVAGLNGDGKSRVNHGVHRYLEGLPLKREHAHAVLTHSLPFTKTLGLSAMVGVMGQKEAGRFFHRHPKHLLFRGHSHTPEIIFRQNGNLMFQTIDPGAVIDLSDKTPGVITCGALMNGLCMIWRPKEQRIECHLI